jgi:hypothetical protein
MKSGLLVVSIIGLTVTCTTWANDLPSLGYSPGIPVKDLVAKGYRWVTVNGPYACITEEDVRQITSDHTDFRELHMVENLRASYLIPGTLARIIQDDHANGMSEILLAGIKRHLWTYTKYLSARPIQTPTELSKHRTMRAWLTQATPRSSGKPVGEHCTIGHKRGLRER